MFQFIYNVPLTKCSKRFYWNVFVSIVVTKTIRSAGQYTIGNLLRWAQPNVNEENVNWDIFNVFIFTCLNYEEKTNWYEIYQRSKNRRITLNSYWDRLYITGYHSVSPLVYVVQYVIVGVSILCFWLLTWAMQFNDIIIFFQKVWLCYIYWRHSST